MARKPIHIFVVVFLLSGASGSTNLRGTHGGVRVAADTASSANVSYCCFWCSAGGCSAEFSPIDMHVPMDAGKCIKDGTKVAIPGHGEKCSVNTTTPRQSATMVNISNLSTETSELLAASLLPVVVVPPVVSPIVPEIVPAVVGPVVVPPVVPIVPVLPPVVPILLENSSIGGLSVTAKETNETSSDDESRPASEMLQAAGWGAEGEHWAAVGQGYANQYSHMGQAYANQYSHMGQDYANQYSHMGQQYANQYAGVGQAYANQYGR